MWILMQTEERQRACEQISHLSRLHKESPCFPPKKNSFPSPPQIYHSTSCPSIPLPSIHLLPPFLLQRMRGIRSILSLCIYSPLSFCLLTMPAISHIFCALGFFPRSILTILSAYSTQLEWSRSWPCISVQPVSSFVCSQCQPPTCHGILTPPRPGGPLGPGGPGGPGFPGVPGSPSLPRGPGLPWNRQLILKSIKSIKRTRIWPKIGHGRHLLLLISKDQFDSYS